MCEKVGKSRNTLFFQWYACSGGSKSRLAKAAGAEPSGQMRDEKLRAVVARSTFRSQNVQNTPASDHFWKLRCRKSARRCGAKYISKSKCTQHLCRTTFGSWDVEKVHAVVARSTSRSQNVKNTRGLDHFWTLRCRSAWQVQGIVDLVKSEQNVTVAFSTTTTTTPHYTPIHYTTTTTTPSLHYTTLHYTTFNYIQLLSIALHYTTLHYTTLCYPALHYTTFHYTTLQYITLHYTPLNYITLHYTTLHSTRLHYITLHYTPLRYTTTTLHYHYTTLHYTTLHSITPRYATLNYTTLHSTTLHSTTLH